MDRILPNRFRILTMLLCLAMATAGAATAQNSFLQGLTSVKTVASTVPANGDVNPYGVFVVPATTGKLTQGNILVSNFNNSKNQQGTGSTIVQISPTGAVELFAQIKASSLPGPCPGGVGLTTALVVLRTGWVIVGSLPTSDGTSATAKAGCLLVLDHNGQVVETISGNPINGPWDMTAFDGTTAAALIVTNVLNGTVANSPKVTNQATVVRLDLSVSAQTKPQVTATTVIGSGLPARTDPTALVVGPTGVALDEGADLLFVADSVGNRIAVIPSPLTRTSSAGTGITISQGGSLNDPLGMTLAPNHNVIVANGGDGNLVELTHQGQQVATKLVDSSGSPPGSGALFGLAATTDRIFFVDDATNSLNVVE